jgi:hypothetical protein
MLPPPKQISSVKQWKMRTFRIPVRHPAHIQALDVLHLAVVTVAPRLAGEQLSSAKAPPDETAQLSDSIPPNVQINNCTMR